MRGRMVILTYKVSFLWASVWWDWSLTETQINKLVCKFVFFCCSFVGCKAVKAPGGRRQGWHFQSCYHVHVCMLKKEIMSSHHLLRLIRNLTVSHEDMSALHKDTHRKPETNVTYDLLTSDLYGRLQNMTVWSINNTQLELHHDVFGLKHRCLPHQWIHSDNNMQANYRCHSMLTMWEMCYLLTETCSLNASVVACINSKYRKYCSLAFSRYFECCCWNKMKRLQTR